jgi:hypothetical protein
MNNFKTESQAHQLIGIFTLLVDSIYRSTPQQITDKYQKGEIKTITNLIRTKEFRDLIKSENDIESPDFKRALAIHLSDCPPLAFIEDGSTNTLDRLQHWLVIKFKYELLYYSLENPLSGVENPYKDLNLHIKKLIDLIRDDYITLYWVLHDGWDFISERIEKSNVPILKVLKTPGKMFLEIISQEMYYEFLIAFPEDILNRGNNFESFSPRQSVKRTIEYEKLKSKEKIEDLSKCEIAKLERLKKEAKDIYKKTWGTFLRDFCINACKNASKEFTVNRKLSEHKKVSDELWTTVKALSRDINGSAWHNGIRLSGKKKGGTYSR